MLSLREMCSSAKLILVSYPTCGELERHPLSSLTLRVRSWQSNLQENTSSSSFLHIIELRVIVSKLRGLSHSCRLASSQRTWRLVCCYLNSERESVDKAYIVRQNQRRIEKHMCHVKGNWLARLRKAQAFLVLTGSWQFEILPTDIQALLIG